MFRDIWRRIASRRKAYAKKKEKGKKYKIYVHNNVTHATEELRPGYIKQKTLNSRTYAEEKSVFNQNEIFSYVSNNMQSSWKIFSFELI